MRRTALGLVASWLLWGCPLAAQTVPVPPLLEDWQAWAIAGREGFACPYVDGTDATQVQLRVCAWPGPLDIEAGATSARFTQRVRLYAAGWVPLPGDAEHWPQEVVADGGSVPVVEHEGRPQVRLAAGEHLVTGVVMWPSMPDSLPLPASVGIVRLTVDGRRVDSPERSTSAVRLGARRTVTEANQIDVQVHRRLIDSIPGRLETRVLLQVSGEPREVTVGPVLPTGFTPLALSSAIPARLDPDGRLRVQVRAGSWTLGLDARSAGPLGEITLPESLPAEIWSFDAVDRLRSVSVEGAATTDPAQANVPGDWQQLPAYRIEPGTTLRVVERSRGVGGQDLDRMQIERDLWWDFGGRGYTFRDQLSGRLQQNWRLDTSAPYLLQGARSYGAPMLVTRGADGRTGIEVRTPDLGIEAAGRIDGGQRSLPASGWNRHVSALGINLHLPPGHRLIAAPGADESRQSWLERWRLLDIFGVLLVAAVAFRLAGLRTAAIVLVGLTLAHHEWPLLTWLTLNLLIAIALAGAAPVGRLQRWAIVWRAASFVIVAAAFVPFALSQARLAFFPQLETRAALPRTGLQDAPESVEVTAEREVAQDSAGPPTELSKVQSAGESAKYRVAPSAPPPAPRYDLQRYAADVRLQNGPGVPQWQFQSYRLQWNGPVEPEQSLRLIVLEPFWVSLWRLTSIALLALVFAMLARASHKFVASPWFDRWLRRPGDTGATLGVLLVAGLAAATFAPRSSADVPTKELIEELGQRLSRPPDCAPTCTQIAKAVVRLDGERLEVHLEAHAATRAVLTLPQAPQRWSVDGVIVDDAAARAVAQPAGGALAIALEPGVHEVEIRGRIVAADAIRLTFPARPARIAVVAPGWEASGVEQGRLLGDGLSLLRLRSQSEGRADSVDDEFPPYVRVTRTLSLGLDWEVRVDVERLAPPQGAFVVELPLIAGESVLTAQVPVRDGHVVLAFPAGAHSVGWTSKVARTSELELSAPAAVPWVEVWRIAAGPLWHVEYSGTPEVFPDSGPGASAIRQFEPRPGEKLQLVVTQPEGVEGATFAFESVRHQLSVGRRATDSVLTIAYRSTQGGRHVVRLPEGARLEYVRSDQQPLTLDERDGEIALPLQPGEHTLELAWQVARGTSLATRPDPVDLRAPSSNVTTSIALPDSRWILFARGGGVGPAILYWAELVVFVAIALLLGRYAKTPLSTPEWLLVGLGLSTFSWTVLLLFAAWIFALDWRRRWLGAVSPTLFNIVQVLLAILTVVALGSLLAAIPNGLLGQPDMRIDAPLYEPAALTWFHDRIADTLPQPLVVSVSLWFYKAAMLAWALWLSFALVRWVRWAWQSFSTTTLWRRGEVVRPQQPGASPPATGT